jgi:hypothetical protein
LFNTNFKKLFYYEKITLLYALLLCSRINSQTFRLIARKEQQLGTASLNQQNTNVGTPNIAFLMLELMLEHL